MLFKANTFTILTSVISCYSCQNKDRVKAEKLEKVVLFKHLPLFPFIFLLPTLLPFTSSLSLSHCQVCHLML